MPWCLKKVSVDLAGEFGIAEVSSLFSHSQYVFVDLPPIALPMIISDKQRRVLRALRLS
jgi:hypothetical protein